MVLLKSDGKCFQLRNYGNELCTVLVIILIIVAEAWGVKSSEGRKVNVLEMNCLRSLVVVSRLDRDRNEEMRRRAEIEIEVASRADQRVLRWFGHVERMDEYRMEDEYEVDRG